ncbi:NAD dependent epimerase/dehydratase family protein [Pelagimonas phthalicica]|uniref:NAD dependent epimerase/dehydratase family protein n=1 Tax=Pelagimonas phthalicica TaxID=1037362 RepID=A0A238JFW6_9RHOB|nr:NAD(P)-dependent oxidoreductase [Pelagimonas phthalicica]TDS92222.1 nucleoside-diphosphate-sugar epimerase [Pelagimonas phthalicica]SMX29283.1 NAD dependent epimerase/dehydratase family protein [Pelagimonas phthalicica]
MRIAITGASGLLGQPVAQHFSQGNHDITRFGRKADVDWQLGQDVDLSGFDVLIHAGFAHVPGKYRGGEGDNPGDFIHKNQHGTLNLWQAAERARCQVIFLSTRAVYGDYPAGTALFEDMAARPDTLYGRVKHESEKALGNLGVSLRITGVYGPPVPGRGHKWQGLFADFAAGKVSRARAGTEVHIADLIQAIDIIIENGIRGETFNVSDFILDHRDLLETYANLSGINGNFPSLSDSSKVSAMNTDKLRALGWVPRGRDGLEQTLDEIIRCQT